MASREAEKRQRREARLAAEREAAAQADRTRRLRLGGGLALLALILAGVVVALVAGGGGGTGDPKTGGGGGVQLPAQKITDLKAAAAAAGCTLEDYPKDYDRNRSPHLPDTTKIKYRTNPPAFGHHYDIPAKDGDYVGRGTPASGNLVHALEHGRIEVQYRPGLPGADTRQLEALFNEKPDLMLLFRNATGMKDDVAAVAWTHILRCPKFTPKFFDAARAFRDKYTLKAPEVIPQPE